MAFLVRLFFLGSFWPKSYTSTFVCSPGGSHSLPAFFMFPIFSVFLASIDMMGKLWICALPARHVDVAKLGIPVRVVLSAFQVFLVGFKRVAFVLQDTPDRFQTHRKATLG